MPPYQARPSRCRAAVLPMLFFFLMHSPLLLSAEVTAIFAGGCFWCMEKPFDELEGVLDTTSGYIGGHTKNPTYKAVSAGFTGHIEAVRVAYDPDITDYLTLLRTFWVNIDPFDPSGQFCDKGSQYVSAIFVGDESSREMAEKTLQAIDRLFPQQQVATRILPETEFYPAENYHQDYYQKNPLRYNFYRSRCGRDDRLQQLWDNRKLPF